jgi:small subunit ribosomal protein S8
MIATNDPISDMLTRFRNASAVRKSEVSLPHSKVKESVARILVLSGFIDKVEVKSSEVGIGKIMNVTLFDETSNPRITEIVRLSKPGRRSYTGSKEIPTVKHGRGLVIVSTSKGMMSGEDARKQGIGGELICRIY